jgi:hypothetical protein
LDFRNNIVFRSGSHGVNDDGSAFDFFLYNLINDAPTGLCNGCTLDPSNLTMDPLLSSPGASKDPADFELSGSSPAIDKGFDVGIDRNAPGGLNYDGMAPDIGFRERG